MLTGGACRDPEPRRPGAVGGAGGGRSGVLDPLWRDGLRGAVPDRAGVRRSARSRPDRRDPVGSGGRAGRGAHPAGRAGAGQVRRSAAGAPAGRPEDLDRSRRAEASRAERFATCRRVLEEEGWPWDLIDVEPLLDDGATVIQYLGPHHLDVAAIRARFRMTCDLDVVLEPVGTDDDEADRGRGRSGRLRLGRLRLGRLRQREPDPGDRPIPPAPAAGRRVMAAAPPAGSAGWRPCAAMSRPAAGLTPLGRARPAKRATATSTSGDLRPGRRLAWRRRRTSAGSSIRPSAASMRVRTGSNQGLGRPGTIAGSPDGRRTPGRAARPTPR